MQIIPVIDLKDGCVVYAQHGNRSNYRPLTSQLCQSSSIVNVLDAFLNLYDFKTFYIADLNAICKNGNHQEMIDDLIKSHTHCDFWVDNGMTLTDLSQSVYIQYKAVIGTESQLSVTARPESDFILSLDFKHDKPQGPLELFENNNHWPKNIIIMTLARVGSRAGPDFVRLSQYCQQYPQNNFIAAGGIRHIDDLAELNRIGVKQALLASSLHSGAITSTAIKNLS